MGAFTIGNSVSTRPKDSVNCHPSVLWGCTAWASSLQLLTEGSHDTVSWPRSCPVAHGKRTKQRVTGSKFSWERESESQGSPASSLGKTTGVHRGSNPSHGTKYDTGEKRFPQFLLLQREGLWTSAHQRTCLIKVTLPVLWSWDNCKLSIYKWSLLNPILHECWNTCTTYKAESYWLRNTGL